MHILRGMTAVHVSLVLGETFCIVESLDDSADLTDLQAYTHQL